MIHTARDGDVQVISQCSSLYMLERLQSELPESNEWRNQNIEFTAWGSGAYTENGRSTPGAML